MRLLALILLLAAAPLRAEDITLSAPPALEDSGVLSYILPRFALKHGVRVTLGPPPANAALGAEGVPVMTGLGQTWALRHDGSPGAVKLQDWLTSEIGRNTLAAFQPAGRPVFTPPVAAPAAAVALDLQGDAATGAQISRDHCGRCHRIAPGDRFGDMGATPSFPVLRTLPDWQTRFEGFYALNPHPSFTQVAGVTPPFDPARPPVLVPVEITRGELGHILAYVATVAPADLGAPIQSQ